MKPMTRNVSFVPTPEVRELLEQARGAGLELTEIINDALREKGPVIARSMAEDAQKRLQAFLGGKV